MLAKMLRQRYVQSVPRRPREKLFLFDLDQWGKKKNPWMDDRKNPWREGRRSDSTNMLPIKAALTKKKEAKSAFTNNSKPEVKGSHCFVSITYKECFPLRKPGDPFLLRFEIRDEGPHAYADGQRTLAFNKFLRTYFTLGNYLPIAKSAQRIPNLFCTQMIINGAIPDLDTFSILIRHYCKYFSYEHILDVVFTQMKALGVEADDTFSRSLIYGICARFGPSVGYRLLKELRSDCGIPMPLSCYDAIVRHFLKSSSSVSSTSGQELIDVLMDMKQQGHFPDHRIYDCLMKGRRYHWGESFVKAAGIGRQMFTGSLKIGFVSNVVVKKRSKKFVLYRAIDSNVNLFSF